MTKPSNTKHLLFSVTKDDCEWSTFKGSGPGGQHRNKVETAVRCRHRASGAVGQASDDRSQLINKRNAFARMASTTEFKTWHKAEVARRLGKTAKMEEDVERAVDLMMRPEHLRVEYLAIDGD